MLIKRGLFLIGLLLVGASLPWYLWYLLVLLGLLLFDHYLEVLWLALIFDLQLWAGTFRPLAYLPLTILTLVSLLLIEYLKPRLNLS